MPSVLRRPVSVIPVRKSRGGPWRDYQFFRDALVEAAAKHGLTIHAYVWMTNHVHLLATPAFDDSISKASINAAFQISKSRIRLWLDLTLGHLNAMLNLGRIEPREGMTSEDIEVRQITYQMPGVGEMLKLARAQALNGQAAEAELTRERLCQIHPKSTCEGALKALSEIASTKD